MVPASVTVPLCFFCDAAAVIHFHSRIATLPGHVHVSLQQVSSGDQGGAVQHPDAVAPARHAARPLVTMFTTPYHSDGTQKTRIQHNAIVALAALPRVRVVLFTTDPEWKRLAEAVGAAVYTQFDTAIGTVPVLRDMFTRVLDTSTTPLVGFVNGDILLSTDFVETLEAVHAATEDGRLTNRTMVVGRRYNIDETVAGGAWLSAPATVDSVKTLHGRFVEGHKQAGKQLKPFTPLSADYFIVSRTAFDWQREIPPFVIARIRFDNWLMQHGLEAGVDVVDATATVIGVHMTDRGGIYNGFNAKNPKYDERLTNGRIKLGSTKFCRFATVAVDAAGNAGDVGHGQLLRPPAPSATSTGVGIVQRHDRSWHLLSPTALKLSNWKPCGENPDWWMCVDARNAKPSALAVPSPSPSPYPSPSPRPRVVTPARHAARPLVTMFTTPYHSDGTQKTRIQHNAIVALAALPRVRVVLFTTDPEWKRLAEAVGAAVYTQFDTAIGTVPVLRDMFTRVLDTSTTPLVGFVNGDILLSTDFVETLEAVHAATEDGRLTNRTMVVGRRYNIDETVAGGAWLSAPATVDSVKTLHGRFVEGHKQAGKQLKPFTPLSADYFIVSRTAFDWQREIPPFVIARIRFDNWLMQHGLEAGVDVVDATATVIGVHMTDRGGIYNGFNAKNPKYDERLTNGRIKLGSTKFCRFATVAVDAAGNAGDVGHGQLLRPPAPSATSTGVGIVQRHDRSWHLLSPTALKLSNWKPCGENPDWWMCVDARNAKA